MWHLLIAFCLLHVTISTPVKVIDAFDEATTRDEDDPYILPTTVLPRHYAVTLKLEENFATRGNFTGSVSIVLEFQEAASEITLHAQNLNIYEENIYLTCNDNNNINLFSALSNATAYHMITITSSSQIQSGSVCTLSINDYVGPLLDDMQGLYRSSYINRKGEKE